MAKGQSKVGQNKSEVITNVPMACADEDAAVHFVEELRWGKGKEHDCPRCGDSDTYTVMDRANPEKRNENNRWRCRGCGKFHTVRTGTVMEDSRIPMRHWCLAFWRCCSSKMGISAKQIERETGLSYKSALFLMHRVRFALADMSGCKLTGTVEADETYVGGKPRNRGNNKRGRGTKKQPVMAMVERGGRVKTRVVPDVTAKTLKGAIRDHVDKQARIVTDENPAYNGLDREYAGGHETTQHGRGEYVRLGTDIHSNTIEGFFSLLKRGVYGTFHNVSRTHLHRYLSEFEFRYNTRELNDGERVIAAIKAGEGKRLIYRYPANGAA